MTTDDKSATYTEPGVAGMMSDWAADKQTFDMPWGKIMMWIFLPKRSWLTYWAMNPSHQLVWLPIIRIGSPLSTG